MSVFFPFFLVVVVVVICKLFFLGWIFPVFSISDDLSRVCADIYHWSFWNVLMSPPAIAKSITLKEYICPNPLLSKLSISLILVEFTVMITKLCVHKPRCGGKPLPLSSLRVLRWLLATQLGNFPPITSQLNCILLRAITVLNRFFCIALNQSCVID